MVALALAAVVAASGVMAPRAPLVSSEFNRVKADVGSYCVSGTSGDGQEVGLCADSIPPTKPPSPRLEAGGAERILVRFRHRQGLDDEVADFTAELARVTERGPRTLGPLEPRRVDGTKRTWELRLPQDLGGANALVIFSTLESGDAMFTAGLRQVAASDRVICPATGGNAFDTAELIGLTVDEADTYAARFGCTVRVGERDGVSLPGTSDFVASRVNVAVRDGRVERIFGVG